MRRREYLAAAAAVLGVTAGCLDQSETMSQEQAYNEFERIAVFSAPDDSNARRVARMVDEEAGVVLYGADYNDGSKISGGVSLSAVPVSQTDLDTS